MESKKEINIVVTGFAGSGKSRIIHLIKEMLKDKGFETEFDGGKDFNSEASFDNSMNKNNKRAISEISKNRKVIFSEVQQNRSLKPIYVRTNDVGKKIRFSGHKTITDSKGFTIDSFTLNIEGKICSYTEKGVKVRTVNLFNKPYGVEIKETTKSPRNSKFIDMSMPKYIWIDHGKYDIINYKKTGNSEYEIATKEVNKNKGGDVYKVLSNKGFDVLKGERQFFGSSADIYAEYNGYWLLIDDGTVDPFNTVYHLYCRIGDIKSKVMECKIESEDELISMIDLMKLDR